MKKITPAGYRLLIMLEKAGPVGIVEAAKRLGSRVHHVAIVRNRLLSDGLISPLTYWAQPMELTDAGRAALASGGDEGLP